MATDAPAYGAAGLTLSLALALTGLGALLLRLLPGRRPAGEQEVLDWFEAWLTRYRPTRSACTSGGASSAYQANMWLEPLARLDGRPVIVLRERHMVQRIAATDIPVVCLPKVATLMRLEHSTLRVLLHPSNSGKTSQVLRIPTIKHAFVNHGESDKLSSCNPYAKAYDEVWVAGPAARERYAQAEVGVEDKDVVEIGRPQLDADGRTRGRPRPGRSRPSCTRRPGRAGRQSRQHVRRSRPQYLVARCPGPAHDRCTSRTRATGSVDPRAGAADLRIRELVRAANRERGGPRPDPSAATGLARRAAELDRLTATTVSGRRRTRRSGCCDSPRRSPDGRCGAAGGGRVEEAYWASLPEWEHQVVTKARPSLYAASTGPPADQRCVERDQRLPGERQAVRGRQHQHAGRGRVPAVVPDGDGGDRADPRRVRGAGPPRGRCAIRSGTNSPGARRVGPAAAGPGRAAVPGALRGAVRDLCAAAGRHRARMAERLAAELPVPGPRREPARSSAPAPAAAPEPHGHV
ncbi:hypothetical protein SVIOM342S_06319 [Streptomyces violaceorubidus]